MSNKIAIIGSGAWGTALASLYTNQENITVLARSADSLKNSNFPVIIGWIAFVLAPCATCTKFCKTIDIPNAEIKGANLKDPLNGL